jgi:predicted DCC family thiol-disulfide oxidoreductase YuxK
MREGRRRATHAHSSRQLPWIGHSRHMKWVLFFDGDCAFCSSAIRRVNRLDPHGRVDFAPLQGKLAEKLGLQHHATGTGGTMVLLRESDGRIFLRSDALIEVGSAIGGIGRCLVPLAIIPRAWRDKIYQFIADRRRLLPGNQSACPLPDERLRKQLRD